MKLLSVRNEKKSKCQKKKLFFSIVFEKKEMNDKRNLICGNVMLLSQSRDETLFVFAKISVLGEKKIREFRSRNC